MWFVFALLSAVFAALTSILAKVGIEGVNSNLATAIRTVVVLVMAWGMVFVTNTQGGLTDISRKSWLFLILSGLATGASWLCYYRALQIGEASKVVPIDKLSVVITLVLAFVFLHERFTPKSLIGCLLIGAGTLMMVLLYRINTAAGPLTAPPAGVFLFFALMWSRAFFALARLLCRRDRTSPRLHSPPPYLSSPSISFHSTSTTPSS